LNYQKFDEDPVIHRHVCTWLYILIGRLFYKNGA